MKGNIVFLFAHQDDEFGVFHLIKSEISKVSRVVCVYLTDGRHRSANPDIRNNESLTVLKKLGVNKEDVFFLGKQNCIHDGELYLHLDESSISLNSLIVSIGNIEKLYILSWEGGHQDHDAAHVLGVKLAKYLNILDKTYQFPLYNGNKILHPFFKVLSPIKENGVIIQEKIPLLDRFVFIVYCLKYPSQWKTWIGLFPFVVLKFLQGYQTLQKVSLVRISEKPYNGKMLYEKRKILKWSAFSEHIKKQKI